MLCANGDIAAMLAAVQSAALSAGCLHISHMPVPNGQCVVLFIPSAGQPTAWQVATPQSSPALLADDLIEDLALALKRYHSPLALKSNGLVRRLNLAPYRQPNDPANVGDGLALKRAIKAGVAALASSPRSKDHDLAAYFELRYERDASSADVQRALYLTERTAQRRNQALLQRLAEVLCEMQHQGR